MKVILNRNVVESFRHDRQKSNTRCVYVCVTAASRGVYLMQRYARHIKWTKFRRIIIMYNIILIFLP